MSSILKPKYPIGTNVMTPEGWTGTVMSYEYLENEWEYVVANRTAKKMGYFLESALTLA